eukprot:m.121224 g.121224  ORF g.121224 m.121224 type:complete len:180 (-) comp28845_c0_seq2:117-656(-)
MDFVYQRDELANRDLAKRKSEVDHFEESMLAKRLALDLSLGHSKMPMDGESRRKRRGRILPSQPQPRTKTSHVLVPLPVGFGEELGYDAEDELEEDTSTKKKKSGGNEQIEEFLICPRAFAERQHVHLAPKHHFDMDHSDSANGVSCTAIIPYLTPEQRLADLVSLVQQKNDYHMQKCC